MNDEIINDLKQFITATMSQQLAEQSKELRKEIRQVEARLESKIDDLSTYVAEALDASSTAIHEQIDDHEARITKLEQTAA